MCRTLKLFVSLSLAICLLATPALYARATAATISDAQYENARNTLYAVNDLCDVWKAYGFTAEQVADLLSLERRDDGFYEEILEMIPDDLPEAEGLRAPDGGIAPLVFDGNIPSSSEEQADRLLYITGVLDRVYPEYTKGSANYKNYFVYLYTSHYIDNEHYDPAHPNFDDIHAHIICPEDIGVYNSLYKVSHYLDIVDSLSNFAGSIAYLVSDLSTYDDLVEVIDLNTRIFQTYVNTYIADMDQEALFDFGQDVYDAFTKNYTQSVTARDFIDQMNEDLSLEHSFSEALSSAVVGLTVAAVSALSMLDPMVGIYTTAAVVAVDLYTTWVDIGALAMVSYSFSGRVASRFWLGFQNGKL